MRNFVGNNGFMCKYFKKAWDSPVGSQLISQVIYVGSLYIIELATSLISKTFLEEIWKNYSQTIITSAIFISIYIIILNCRRIKSKKLSFLKETKTQEKICGYHWIWQWKYIPEKKKYKILDIKPICEFCGEAMIIPLYSSYYQCMNNHKIESDKINFIVAEDAIVRKIKTNYPNYSDKII